MGKCKGVPSSGGGAGKLLNGVPWKYTTFDEPIKPMRTVGCKGYMDAFKGFTNPAIPENNFNQSGLSYLWLSEDTVLFLYSQKTSVYVIVDSYDIETNMFKTISKTLVKTLDQNNLYSSKMMKISDNEVTLFMSAYSSGNNNSSNRSFWEVNYVKIKIENGMVTIQSSGYINSGISYDQYLVLSDAVYNPNNNTYTMAIIYGNYSTVFICHINGDTMAITKAFNHGNLYGSSAGRTSTSQPNKQVKLALMGDYVVLAALGYTTTRVIRVYDYNSLVFTSGLNVQGTSADSRFDCTSIDVLSNTQILATFCTDTSKQFILITNTNGTFSETTKFLSDGCKFNLANSNTELISINSQRALFLEYGSIGTTSAAGLYYNIIDVSGETLNFSNTLYIIRNSKTIIRLIRPFSGNKFFVSLISSYNYTKCRLSTFELVDNKVVLSGFNVHTFADQYVTSSTTMLSTWLSSDEVVICYQNASNKSALALMKVIDNKLVYQSSLLGIGYIPAYIAALNNTDIILGTERNLYLIRKNADNTLTLVSTNSIAYAKGSILTVLNPKLFLLYNNSYVYPCVVNDDGTVTLKDSIFSDGTTNGYGLTRAYRLTNNSFIIMGYSASYIPLTIATFNADYTVSTTVLSDVNLSILYRLTKKTFLIIPVDLLSTSNVRIVALNDELTNIESIKALPLSTITDEFPSTFNITSNPLSVSPFSNFMENYAPMSTIGIRMTINSLYRHFYFYSYNPNNTIEPLGMFPGLPSGGNFYLSNYEDKYLILYTLPSLNDMYYSLGTIKDILQNDFSNTHLVTSKISKGKYSKSYAIGGALNDEYPY